MLPKRIQFYHVVFAILGLVTGLGVIVCPMATAVAADAKPAAKPVVVVFELRGDLGEQPAEDDLPLFGPPGPWLRDVVTRMKKAADDADVKAVVLLTDGASIGLGQAEEIRATMRKVRDAGKDVFFHSDSTGMGQYFLATAASRVSISPIGDLWITGLYGDGLYLRGLLDKLGITPDILHCGAYKSAGEIFMRDGPSPEADAMTNWLLDSIYDTELNGIADGRKVSRDQASKWVDEAPYTSEKAKAGGMIDAVESRTEFESMLKQKFGQDVTFDRKYGSPKQQQLDFSNPFALLSVFADLMRGGQKSSEPAKPAVAIVYVDGPILLGQREAGLFSGGGAMSTEIARALDKAAADDAVKAVVPAAELIGRLSAEYAAARARLRLR